MNDDKTSTTGDSKPWEMEYSGSVAVFSALANPLRLAITHHLVREPHTVSALYTCLGVSQPLVSHHLKVLKDAHVITSQHKGRSVEYSITDDHIRHIVLDVHEHTKESCHEHPHH